MEKYSLNYTGNEINNLLQITESVPENLNNIEEKVNNHFHEIGGVNYILNSNIVASGWQNGTTVSRTEEGYLKIEVTKEGGACTISNANTVEDNFKNGDAFTFSMNIKSDDTTVLPKVYYNGSLAYKYMLGAVGSEFSTVYDSRIWNDNSLNIHFNFDEIGTYYIKNVKFEKGTCPTDWTPAKEDWEDTGVTGIVTANSGNFNITTAMLGKRIICNSTADHRFVNLPSPVVAGKGAMVEIMANGSQFVEVNTPESTIQKGEINEAKCAQPCHTTRRYYSDGTKWVTNFEKISASFNLEVGFSDADGADTSPKFGWHGGFRIFKSLSNLKHLQEYRRIRARIYNTGSTLDSNVTIEDCELSFVGNYAHGILKIPNDYRFNLINSNIYFSRLTLRTEGTAFKCFGKIGAMLGDMHGMGIQPLSDVAFNVFQYSNSDVSSVNGGCTSLMITMRSCTMNAINLEEYTATGNLIKNEDTTNSNPIIFIDRSASAGWGTKIDSIKLYNGSDTLSRIGTSAIYTVG